MERLETTDKSQIVCPYCGYKFADSWEYTEDDYNDTNLKCRSCCEVFRLFVYVVYSTERIDCDKRTPPSEHEFLASEYSEVSQETCDNLNKKAQKNIYKPHAGWWRTCKKCDVREYTRVAIGAPCPWTNEVEES